MTVDGRKDSSLEGVVLRRVWRAPWRHLPALSAAGCATGLALAAALWITGGIVVATPLVAALLCGPTLLPLFAAVQGALVHDDTELRSYGRDIRRFAVRGTSLTLVAGLCLSAMLAGIEVHARTGSGAVLLSLAVAVTASALTVAGLFALLPLAVARPGLRGLRLWASSWYLLGRWPVRFLAPVSVGALAVWVGTTVHSSLILLLPVPVALMAGSAYWCCALDLGADDVRPGAR